MQAHEARHAAALALGALVAAPWAADSAVSEASEVEIGGGGGATAGAADKAPRRDAKAIVLQRLRDTGLQKQLLAPLGQTAAADDRCVVVESVFEKLCFLPLPRRPVHCRGLDSIQAVAVAAGEAPSETCVQRQHVPCM